MHPPDALLHFAGPRSALSEFKEFLQICVCLFLEWDNQSEDRQGLPAMEMQQINSLSSTSTSKRGHGKVKQGEIFIWRRAHHLLIVASFY